MVVLACRGGCAAARVVLRRCEAWQGRAWCVLERACKRARANTGVWLAPQVRGAGGWLAPQARKILARVGRRRCRAL